MLGEELIGDVVEGGIDIASGILFSKEISRKTRIGCGIGVTVVTLAVAVGLYHLFQSPSDAGSKKPHSHTDTSSVHTLFIQQGDSLHQALTIEYGNIEPFLYPIDDFTK